MKPPSTSIVSDLSTYPKHREAEEKGGGGTIALLNVPPNTSLSLNGCPTRTLCGEEPLIVVYGITPACGFHLLVVRAGGNATSGSSCHLLHGSAVVLLHNRQEKEERDNWFVARRYYARTEELSSNEEEVTTRDNLHDAIRRYLRPHEEGNDGDGRGSPLALNPTRVIPYETFTTPNERHIHNTNHDNHPQLRRSDWSTYLTNRISHRVLQRHNLSGNGDKVVPGTYRADDLDLERNEDHNHQNKQSTTPNRPPVLQDGIAPCYPPIPCIDTQHNTTQFRTHEGTRRFLARLSPNERTSLFLRMTNSPVETEGTTTTSVLPSIPDTMFRKVLEEEYDGMWEVLLGEWQLAFVLFVCLGCLSSLEHWRDTLAMLSVVDLSTIETHIRLYDELLTCLSKQLVNFEGGALLDDLDYSRDNFLLPALRTLHNTCTNISDQDDRRRLTNKAHRVLQRVSPPNDDDAEIEEECAKESNENKNKKETRTEPRLPDADAIFSGINDDGNDDYDSDEDGPVVVPYNEIEASMARSTPMETDDGNITHHNETTSECKRYGTTYPLLFAASMAVGGEGGEGGEDILMTCARVLDERRDVSLVREAAAYLEEVEAKR